MKTLYLVIPCYNEAEVLHETAKRLLAKLDNLIKVEKISISSRILFVNDGSKDNTWEIIKHLHVENELFTGISLSHNKGQQNALLAGLMTAKEYADMIISVDADLQDDINVIDMMVDEYYMGNDIIYGVRSSRKSDSFLRRITAENFYRVMKMLGIEVMFNNSSCRLMSRRAVEALSDYKEVNLFLPGLVPLLGFKNSIVRYERKERYAGKTKYSFKQLFSLAAEAITSFSLKPIRFIRSVGILFFLTSVGIVVYHLAQTANSDTESWLIIFASIWAIGGIMLMSIGVVGEYVGKTYFEIKQRPRYIISEILIDPKTD
ncbi:MAG: glycosyltransferase family 2 protein [Eubacteriales bacterium]